MAPTAHVVRQLQSNEDQFFNIVADKAKGGIHPLIYRLCTEQVTIKNGLIGWLFYKKFGGCIAPDDGKKVILDEMLNLWSIEIQNGNNRLPPFDKLKHEQYFTLLFNQFHKKGIKFDRYDFMPDTRHADPQRNFATYDQTVWIISKYKRQEVDTIRGISMGTCGESYVR